MKKIFLILLMCGIAVHFTMSSLTWRTMKTDSKRAVINAVANEVFKRSTGCIKARVRVREGVKRTNFKIGRAHV